MSDRLKTSNVRYVLRSRPWGPQWIHAALLALMTLVSALSSDAAEGKRVAFVVGIGTYDNLAADKQLTNAVNDAEGVSAKLSQIGFQVTRAPNLKRAAFNEKWQNVLDSLTADDTFVLFFSGHGVQVDGQNYLLPRDIPDIEYGRQAQLTREAISLNELLTDLSTGDRPHPKHSVVILDACRDNPLVPPGYKSLSTSRGLANVPESAGIFVMYAAASNTTALDRLSSSDTSKYLVFTRTLLPLIERKDLSIQELSNDLKNQVWKLAQRAKRMQRPAYYDGIVGDRFCLPGCAMEADNATSAQPGLPNEKIGKDGAPMVLIPGGEFWIGSSAGEGRTGEHPRHQVMLDGFYMDKFEVTVERYFQFIQAKNWLKPDYWDLVVKRKHWNLPVIGVDWLDAKAYCEWAAKRLPTEAEWEKAARGTDGRTYPWGNGSPTARRANFGKETTHNVYDDRLAPVDSHETGKSPYGLYQMAGNAYEWTADWYDEFYYGKGTRRNPSGPQNGQYRVLRGGSWSHESDLIRSALRNRTSPTLRNDFIGFRCAQDVPQ